MPPFAWYLTVLIVLCAMAVLATLIRNETGLSAFGDHLPGLRRCPEKQAQGP
jgi:hypothetical protein